MAFSLKKFLIYMILSIFCFTYLSPVVGFQGTEAIEGISFDLSALGEIQFTTEAFNNMKGLRLLKVFRDELLSNDPNTVHLPEEFEFPSYELRYLRWDGWSLESLPSNFKGENLVELSLKHSSLNHLWKGNKV